MFKIPFLISDKSVKMRKSVSPDLKGVKVLIADGNVEFQKILKRMLEYLTFDVSTADNGESAVLKAEQNRPMLKAFHIDWLS